MTVQRVLVTGGANGLGRAIVERFAAAGADVAIADLDSDSADAAAETIHPRPKVIRMDMRSADEVSDGVDGAAAALGGLDVLVNCAGIELVGPLLESDEESLRNLFDVNVFGAFRVTKAALSHLRASSHPAIVNISSAAGLAGSPLLAAYSMSKAALIRMTEALAIELRPVGIRCNAICPALTGPTRMVDALIAPFAAMGVPIEQVLAKQGGRMCRAEEVAELVAFLSSTESSLINGAHYVIDGGLTASVL